MELDGSALSVGAGIVTFDGSVTTPSIGVLWDIVEEGQSIRD